MKEASVRHIVRTGIWGDFWMTGFPAIVGGDVQTANGGVGNTHSAVLDGGDASEGKKRHRRCPTFVEKGNINSRGIGDA